MKIFCIGFNKTGTTSLSDFFQKNNFAVAPQKPFECNLESYFYNNYSTFTKMIDSDYYQYSFFQDIPFSLPFFYKELDSTYRDAKFILTIRDSEHEWYNSIINFYKKIFWNFNNPSKIGYIYEGLIFKILTKAYGAPKVNPYDEVSLKNAYLSHIQDVTEYFYNRNNLLVINLKEKNVVSRIESFLDLNLHHKEMSHINKTT